ncbi:MAG: right-handed parallel beta-helix repeat-containing protein [Planctomycetota bacterium]|nr:right-handed parallel beta-helix repeat-containing protein [Planctomycetota bacterium]
MNAREPHFTLRTLALLCGALELGVALNAAAAEYVVDGSHPQASDVNPGTAERPWKSIAMANKALAPGDTVYIKAGTYGDFIAPEQSGTAAGRITYRNFKDEQVKIAEAQKGILLVGKSYVTVEGLSFSHLDEFMRLEQASHNAIVRCVFSQMRKRSQWAGARIWKDSQYNTLRQCSFSKWGWYTDDDKGCLLDIGNENSKVEQTAYNLIEGCEFFHGGHHLVGVYSKCNVFRNNYFHNENWLKDDAGKNLWGNRNLMTSGFDECSGRNLFEGNRVAFSGYPRTTTAPQGWACLRAGISCASTASTGTTRPG